MIYGGAEQEGFAQKLCFAVLLRYSRWWLWLSWKYILRIAHQRTKGDDATRRRRRKIFKALSLLLFFRLGMRIINYSFQKRRQNKPCFSLKAEAALAKHIHPSFAAVIVPMRFSKKENIFRFLSDKKSRGFPTIAKAGLKPSISWLFFLLALLKPRKVLWSLKSNAVSAITTAQWKTDLLFSYSLNEEDLNNKRVVLLLFFCLLAQS